jgi:hypothetical protein
MVQGRASALIVGDGVGESRFGGMGRAVTE